MQTSVIFLSSIELLNSSLSICDPQMIVVMPEDLSVFFTFADCEDRSRCGL